MITPPLNKFSIFSNKTRTHREFFIKIQNRTWRILKLRNKASSQIASLQNDAYDAANLYEISTLPESKPRVLFVMDGLTISGGVERRLELQFNWLVENGVQPIIVAEFQHYSPLSKYPHLKIQKDAPNTDQKLIDLIRWTKASTLEFNMKDTKLFRTVDLLTLKRFVRIGCMIHGKIQVDQERLNLLDYRCSSYKTRYQDISIIPNSVHFSEKIPKYNINSKKALYIGRIDDEKLPTIKNFVKICNQHNLSFEIAGPLYHHSKTLDFIRSISNGSFIGVIDTHEFLEKHGGEYAFIAGVGQVPLEASAANLPSLVVTHKPNPDFSIFLTEENIDILLDWNCVINQMPENIIKANIDTFFEAKDIAESLKNSDPLSKYRVQNLLKDRRSQDQVMKSYLKILLKK